MFPVMFQGMRRSAIVALLLFVCSGCGLTSGWVYDAPLPGGADVGDHPITLTADFGDVLDLVPQSSVKIDNVPVGRVSDIELNDDGHSARVTLVVNGEVDLPAGTTARLQTTALLGEKYVALVRPSSSTGIAAAASSGTQLVDGAHIPLDGTSAAAEVEQVLGALSMVLNGGGIGQFQEISRELQAISTDRPEEIRGFLRQMERFVTTLADRKDSITAAIDGLAALSTRLEQDKDKLANALDGLSPGMQVMVDQREELTRMLASLEELSDVTVATLDASQRDIVADFKALDPILTQLAKAGSDLPNSLQILLTYPFPDSVLGAIKGDYLNVFVTTNFRTLPTGCAEGGCAWPQVGSGSAGAAARRSLPSGIGTAATAPPALLPPTSSPVAGASSSSVPAPSLLPSVAAGTPHAAASSQAPTPSGSASPSSPSSATAEPTQLPSGSSAATDPTPEEQP